MNIIRTESTVRIKTGGEGDNSKQFKWKNGQNVTFFLNPDLMQNENGVVVFDCGGYLKKYHPEEYPKYLEHCQKFTTHFNNINNLIT